MPNLHAVPPTPLVVASGNRHKVAEFSTLLEAAGYVVHRAPDDFAPEETGDTFAANASIKARALHALLAAQVPRPVPMVLADDSGLVVPALQGAPGVRSARYAEPADDQDAANRAKLLQAMAALDNKDRAAYFVCALCIITADGTSKTFAGQVNGHIAKQPQGSQGFGYDSIFVPSGHQHAFAQMPSSQKGQLSHRARAVEAWLAT